jgi:putative transposase
MNEEERSAIELILKEGAISRISHNEYCVRSNDASFKVFWQGKVWNCNCEQFISSHKVCIHIKAIAMMLRLPDILTAIMNPEFLSCPSCGAGPAMLKKSGIQRNRSGPTQRFVCRSCGYRFNDRGRFERLRSNPTMILIAIDLYFKGLSTRQISNHLSELYGIDVDHTTVYRWVLRYCNIMKKFETKLLERLKLGDKWHIDETVVKVQNSNRYIWNIMDARTRYLLASSVSLKRDEATFRNIFEQVTGIIQSLPKEVVTDGLATYTRVLADYKTVRHIAGKSLRDKGNNNAVERVNKTIKGRVKVMEKFSSAKGAGLLANGIRIYYNFVRPHSGIGGKTPAEAAGFKYPLRNKLFSLSRTKEGI